MNQTVDKLSYYLSDIIKFSFSILTLWTCKSNSVLQILTTNSNISQSIVCFHCFYKYIFFLFY